jgi:sugar O-acyltransferase (sialic acid O-acetyltransferase NeuD family)
MSLSPNLPLVVLGAGGHAKVLLALAAAAGREVLGLCDPILAADGVASWRDVPVLGDDTDLDALAPEAVELVLGMGQLVGHRHRSRLHDRLKARGFRFAVLVHPSAWVAPGTRLYEGGQIMAGVIVQPDCCVGENAIINTCATIDHDCHIGSHVHVAPSATLCGGVVVGEGAFVGSGATIIQGLRVGEGAVVGAGVTLVRDLPPFHRALGAPLRIEPVATHLKTD